MSADALEFSCKYAVIPKKSDKARILENIIREAIGALAYFINANEKHVLHSAVASGWSYLEYPLMIVDERYCIYIGEYLGDDYTRIITYFSRLLNPSDVLDTTFKVVTSESQKVSLLRLEDLSKFFAAS